MKVLIVNAGSSSLKYQLMEVENHKVLAKGICERIGIADSRLKHQGRGEAVVIDQDMPTHAEAVALVLEQLISPQNGVISSMSEISAVGHRVLHGGAKFTQSVLINQEVKDTIVEYYPLGPLHNPANMMGIEACEKAMPDVPQVAVFDTAFHQTMPAHSYMYGLPYELYEKYDVRRYGFHGTSHRFVSQRIREILGDKADKVVICHLGNGSSLSAVKAGKCMDTSMGLTPLSGPLMGTRCGDIDPAIVPFLMERMQLSAAEMDQLMNKQSGVNGISGVSSDFRDLAAAADAGNERAQLALTMFTYQVRKYIGAYAAAMGGLDTIVFTAGIGENDDIVREDILKELAFLGVEFDCELNKTIHGKETRLSTENSKVEVWVVPTNEELAIALDTAEIARSIHEEK